MTAGTRPTGQALGLGIDVGLSGARAAVLDASGDRLGGGAAPCTHRADRAGVAEHDPVGWLDEAIAAASSAVSDAGVDRVDAIAIGALGPAPVLLDDELAPLRPAPLFSTDDRARAAWQRLAEEHRGLGADHVVPRLQAWDAEAPGTLGSAAWVVDATGFLVGSLIGRPVIDRITVTDHVLEGIAPPVPLPDPEEPTAIAGGLTAAAADRLGLPVGTPVAVGTYDTFVDLAAVPSPPGAVSLLLGSTLVLGSVREVPDAPDGLRACPHVGAGWFVGGWTSAAGAAIDAVASLVGAGDRSALLEAAAGVEPGGDGTVLLPYLAGERAPVWDPAARGVLVGLSLATTPVQLVRATVDGVALSALDLCSRLVAGGPMPDAIETAGGGLRNAAWTRATADALGTPLRSYPELADAGAAARFALAAIGAPAPPPAPRVVAHDPERSRRYAELAAVYGGLYGATADAVHALDALATRPDAGAPDRAVTP